MGCYHSLKCIQVLNLHQSTIWTCMCRPNMLWTLVHNTMNPQDALVMVTLLVKSWPTLSGTYDECYKAHTHWLLA